MLELLGIMPTVALINTWLAVGFLCGIFTRMKHKAKGLGAMLMFWLISGIGFILFLGVASMYSTTKSIMNRRYAMKRYLLTFGLILIAVMTAAGQGYSLEEKLMDAVKRSDLKIVKRLYEQGVAVSSRDDEGQTPLHWGAFKGHKETVRFLVSAGADLNAKNNEDYTPLHIASSEGYTEIVRFLIASGADVNALGKCGSTPLYQAVWKDHAKTVRVLIGSGADVNVIDAEGQTPLHIASGKGYAKTVKVLIAEGADLNARNDYGYTPLYWADAQGYADIVRLLKEAGARE